MYGGVYGLSTTKDNQYSSLNTIYDALSQVYDRAYNNNNSVSSSELATFKHNLEMIIHHNNNKEDTSLFTMSPNKFMLYSIHEFYEKYKLKDYKPKLGKHSKFKPNMNVGMPKTLDYRNQHAVTTPRDQGVCGSCWAFAVTSSLESMYALERGVVATELSVQQLLDCSSEDNSCSGGYLDSAISYFKNQDSITVSRDIQGADLNSDNTRVVDYYQNWLVDQSAYRYVGKKQTCKYNVKNHNHDVEYVGYYSINAGDEDTLINSLVKYGPLPVAINVSPKFVFYNSGIYDDVQCNSANVNHAVLLIGYGIDHNNKRFWLLKNSWGVGWGESGYFRLSREIYNMCGISTNAIVPILKLIDI